MLGALPVAMSLIYNEPYAPQPCIVPYMKTPVAHGASLKDGRLMGGKLPAQGKLWAGFLPVSG